MGDIGIDRWTWKMNEHIRKGHHIIKYDEDKTNEEEIEQQSLLSKRINDGKQEAKT